MDTLSLLIELLKERPALDEKIARLIGRPETTGHIGEYIAASLFGITLENSATIDLLSLKAREPEPR